MIIVVNTITNFNELDKYKIIFCSSINLHRMLIRATHFNSRQFAGIQLCIVIPSKYIFHCCTCVACVCVCVCVCTVVMSESTSQNRFH